MHTKVGYVRCGSTPQVERPMGAEGTPVVNKQLSYCGDCFFKYDSLTRPGYEYQHGE